MTWAQAVDAYGWHLSPTVGGCQIIDTGPIPRPVLSNLENGHRESAPHPVGDA